MLLTSAVAVFLIVWSSLFLIDYVSRIKKVQFYLDLVEKYGLEVSICQIRFYTTHRNPDGVDALPNKRLSLSRVLTAVWFGIGALVAVLCLVLITGYLISLLYADIIQLAAYRPPVASFRSGPSVQKTTAPPITEHVAVENLPPAPHDYDVLEGDRAENGLVPIIPGVNLPWEHIPVFMIVLVVSAIVHELGHSSAADANGVQVNGFGIFIFALYPGAFTDIEPTSLKRASPFRRLMIFGGGIWHNVLLAGLAYVLYISTPFLLTPLYQQGNGVVVTNVHARSGLADAGGLSPGDIVNNIEECPVNYVSDWRQCVLELDRHRHGRCVPRSQVDLARAGKALISDNEVQCCDEFANVSRAHICFESVVESVSTQISTKAPSLHRVLKLGADEMKNGRELIREKREWARQFSCLSARYVTQQPVCNSSTYEGCQQTNPLDPNICVFAALYNGTQLVRISLSGQTKPVLFVGDLSELISFVEIHGMVPRWSWIPTGLSEFFELLPKYLFTLSVALAALNAVPCYALDGQYIVITIVHWLGSGLSKRRRHQIISLILTLGTALLVANIVIGFLKFLF